MRRFVFLSFTVFATGCFEPEDPAIAGTSTAGSGSSSGEDTSTAGVTTLPAATGSTTESVDGSTSFTPNTTSTSSTGGEEDSTTAGCMPGVFGRSQFGNACFQ